MSRQSRIQPPHSSETTEPRSQDSELDITHVEKPRVTAPTRQSPEQLRLVEQKEIKDRASRLDEELAWILTKDFAEEQRFEDLKRIKDRLDMERDLREGEPDVLTILRHRLDADETLYNEAIAIREENPEEFERRIEEIDRRGDLNVESEVRKIDIHLGKRKHDAVFKPQDGEPLRFARRELVGTVTGNHEPRGYLREWLAGFIAKAMESDRLVPPTVIREIDGRIGSVQKWVDGTLAGERENWLGTSNPGDLEALAALDYLLENRDRHRNNFLIDNSGRVTAIDHGIVLSIDEGHSIRSYPLRAFSGKEISTQTQSQLGILARTGPRRQALEKAFLFAFGEEGNEVFARFLTRVQSLTETGRFPEYSFPNERDETIYGLDFDEAQNPPAG